MLFWNVTVNDLRPDELEPGLEVDGGVAVAGQVEVVDGRVVLDHDRVRPREDARDLLAAGVVQRDVEAVVHADDSRQRRVVAERGAGKSGDRKDGEGEGKPHLTTEWSTATLMVNSLAKK